MRPIHLLLAFAFALPLAAEPCPSPRSTEILAPGLTHHLLCRGAAATSTGYRVLVGTFARQSLADSLLQRLEEGGFEALPTTDGDDYRVVTPAYTEKSRAKEIARRLLAEGFEPPLLVEDTQQDLTHPEGPWRIHLLEVDPSQIEVRVAHALDAAIGIETTTALASRRGALAAINGGYYRMTGPWAGDSQGVLKIDGVLLSEPDRGRAAVGFFDDGEVTESVFGRLAFHGEVQIGDLAPLALAGLNRPRGRAEIVLYTPEFHATTLTDSEGLEIVVEAGSVERIRESSGNSPIPFSGYVLSVGPDRIEEILPALSPGQRISLTTELRPLLPDPDGAWKRTQSILGGGPLLLWNGKRIEQPSEESISRVFFLARHPRTAVGRRADGTLLLITVDGRQPQRSVGMNLRELTDLFLELEAVFAVNLDGGGSTTMSIRGRTVNEPSSHGRDRENGDALLLFERGE